MIQKAFNIMIFSPFAIENGRGGEISSMDLATGLQKYYNITFFDTNVVSEKILLSKDVTDKKLKEIKKRCRMKFATFNIFNRTFAFPYPWEVIKLYKIIKKNDIIYSSVSTIKLGLIFMLFSLLNRRVRYIIGYRRPLHSEKFFSLYNLKYRISIAFYSLFKKRFYHHTISQHAKRFLDNFYDPNKVKHIVHGINLDDYIDNGKKKESKNILKFIYIGFLDNFHKGVSILIKGIELFLKENNDLRIFFEFCGIGPLESRLRELEKRFPDYIKYHGYIDNNLISGYYKRNDVFLFCSRREPFGRVLVEALAAKLVIVCTKTFGSIEILKGKEFAFFVQNLNEKAIKNKIYEVYDLWRNDTERFKELQKSAKKYAFQNYSFSKELEMFKTLIEKIRNFKI